MDLFFICLLYINGQGFEQRMMFKQPFTSMLACKAVLDEALYGVDMTRYDKVDVSCVHIRQKNVI